MIEQEELIREKKSFHVINDFVLKQALESVEKETDLILKIIDLADSKEFRTKIPILAYRHCANGAYVYIGGRCRSRKKKKSRRVGRICPGITILDLIMFSWKRIFDDIQCEKKMGNILTSIPLKNL